MSDDADEARRKLALTGSLATFEHAVQNKPIDVLDAQHANDSPVGGVPITWSDPVTGRKLKGRPLTVLPTVDEIRTYSSPRAAVCGLCKHFDLEGGRKQIQKDRVLERVVLEETWMPHHLGPVDSLGVCKARPTMATTYVAPACAEDYQPRQTRH